MYRLGNSLYEHLEELFQDCSNSEISLIFYIEEYHVSVQTL